MEPVRLGLVVHTFAMGGLERFVAHMLNGLDRSQIRPTLICINRSTTAQEWLTCSDVEIVELQKPPLGGEWQASGRLVKAIRQLGLEVLHSHNWGTLMETSLACWRLRGIRHVHAERGTVMGGGRGGLKSQFAWLGMRLTLSRCDRVLAVDEAVAGRLNKTTGYPLSKIEVIPNGVPVPPCDDREATRSRIRRELGIPQQAIVFGSIGGLRPVKGFELAIEALAQIRGLPVPPHLILVGEGPLGDTLRTLARERGVEDRVHLVGRHRDIGPWLAAFDLFVNTSLSEGMSQAILEAMGFGLPLVVTDVGGNPSLVGGRDGCGLVLPHRDPVGWAQSLVELATNVDQRQRFSQQGMARHDRDYSLTRMVDRYTRIYLSLCRSGQQGVSSAAP